MPRTPQDELLIFDASGKVSGTGAKVSTIDGRHILVHDDALLSTVDLPLADIAFIEPPDISPETTAAAYNDFTASTMRMLDMRLKSDAALIIPLRQSKGNRISKIPSWGFYAQLLGWEHVRTFIWIYGNEGEHADFQRAVVPYSPVYVFRRGYMPTKMTSPVKYKDFLYHGKRTPSSHDATPELPASLVADLLSLFIDDSNVADMTVFDPFMGGGSIVKWGREIGAKTTGFELEKERFKALAYAWYDPSTLDFRELEDDGE